MPQMNDSDLARLRQLKQWSNVFLCVHIPNTMFTGTIDSPDIEKGERFIPFDNGAFDLRLRNRRSGVHHRLDNYTGKKRGR